MTTVYDRRHFEEAHARLRRAPGELTIADVEQLATFGGAELGREALAARNAALFPAPAVPAPTHGPATKGGLSEASIDAIAEGVVFFVKQQLGPILNRLERVEQQPPSPYYAGVHEQDKAYDRGALVTRSGGLWLALDKTTHVPGRSDQWKLIVKSREAR